MRKEGKIMNESIFRKKTIDRVTSPEQLNDYIRVTTPSIWLVLVTVILLLVGTLIWGIFGTVEISDGDGNIEEVHPITFIMN